MGRTKRSVRGSRTLIRLPGRGALGLNHARMCVSKSEGVNEMNEKMSFKMGVKCAASFCMGTNLLDVWHVFIC